jgi:hypothetical protein
LFVAWFVVCAWVEKFSSLVLSIYYSPLLKPPQMPPHRENNNNSSNNNDNNINNLYDVVQQLAIGRAQLMQMMTQFIQASTNPMNNNNNPPPPPQVDRLARFLKLRPNKFSSARDPIVADD